MVVAVAQLRCLFGSGFDSIFERRALVVTFFASDLHPICLHAEHGRLSHLIGATPASNQVISQAAQGFPLDIDRFICEAWLNSNMFLTETSKSISLLHWAKCPRNRMDGSDVLSFAMLTTQT